MASSAKRKAAILLMQPHSAPSCARKVSSRIDRLPRMLPSSTTDLRHEVAAAAARLIAQDGLDYARAKEKAWHAIAGNHAPARAALPDNAQVEVELRRWLATFGGTAHRQHLQALRTLALQLMQRLTQFQPHLTGAVLNGTATEHSDIHLLLYSDSAKDVEHFLLQEGVNFQAFAGEPGEGATGEGAEETIQFVMTPQRIGVVLEIFHPHARRRAAPNRFPDPAAHPLETAGRISLAQLQTLLLP